ncbi:MAG: hypothetical protein HOO06_00090 [Bdellovibrionaceae bacterium]|jgi:hypothetical protein|nr:hypothetical protein [Pseudobdellovibrionaceae bacterium]
MKILISTLVVLFFATMANATTTTNNKVNNSEEITIYQVLLPGELDKLGNSCGKAYGTMADGKIINLDRQSTDSLDNSFAGCFTSLNEAFNSISGT